MVFVPKDWRNFPDLSTPVNAAALVDMEQRLAAYVPTELGYVEATADFTTTSTSSVDVTSMSVAVTVGTRPVLVEAGGPELTSSALNQYAVVQIKEGATELAYTFGGGTTANAQWGWYLRRRLAPSAGSHTYKLALYAFSSGTARVSGAATSPMWLQVTEF